MTNKKFNPLLFLAALGAGGIAISNFVLFNYSIDHGKGLISFAQLHSILNGWQEIFYSVLEVNMATFIVMHLVLTVVFFKKLLPFLKTVEYKELINDPLRNSAILAPFISITMTMNVFIGSVRYFIPWMYNNLQAMMLPGLIVWSIIWILLLRLEVKLLKTSFAKGFDVGKINFGWLLHPFALGMLTVTGTGIAAMAANATIANIAFFMSLVSGSMGLFLLSVKLITLFKSHFNQEALPDKQFLPSFLIVIPNITIFAISLFRIGHFLDHHYGANLSIYYLVVMLSAFAFETWYFMFGLALLKDYFRQHFKNDFHISQWGLVCPFVAYAVLGSFVIMLFANNLFFVWLVYALILFTSSLFWLLLGKNMRCAGLLAKNSLECNYN